MRVLVVDDDPIIRSNLELLLAARGHEVTSFSDPSYCLATSSGNPVCHNEHACADALLVDIDMPYMTGIELLRLQREKSCKIPRENILVVSGHFSQEDSKVLEAMAVAHLDKPVRLAKIDCWLERRVVAGAGA